MHRSAAKFGWNGQEILGLPAAALAKLRGGSLSMIFQEPMAALDPVYTIGEQIAETIIQHDRVDHATAMKRALGLLEQVKIPSAARRLKNYPHEMSGGMRQRAMIALALACSPVVLLADEPTTALDVTVQIQILLLLRQLQQELGMAIVFVTHDVGAAAEISDRIAVMYAGRFVESGTAREIIRSPRHPYTEGLLHSTVHGGMRGTKLETIPGSPPNLAMLPSRLRVRGTLPGTRLRRADRGHSGGDVRDRRDGTVCKGGGDGGSVGAPSAKGGLTRRETGNDRSPGGQRHDQSKLHRANSAGIPEISNCPPHRRE